MKNMIHGDRGKYHRDLSAMCHLMQSGEHGRATSNFSGTISLLFREQHVDRVKFGELGSHFGLYMRTNDMIANFAEDELLWTE